MDAFPASDLVKTGIEDLLGKRETIPALLVAIGAPKAPKAGFKPPRGFTLHP